MAFTISDIPKAPGALLPNTYAIEIPEETPKKIPKHIMEQDGIRRLERWTVVLFSAAGVMMTITCLLLLISEK